MRARGRTKVVAVSATAVLALAATAACSGKGRQHWDIPDPEPAKGGTLTYYTHLHPDHLDPQRLYTGYDLSNWSRTVYRSLVTFPVSEDVGIATTAVPDLATDTGTTFDGAKTWQFTIKDGVTWEDGKPITCEDFKYGASRVFATDVITDGPRYLLTYLDIPADPKTGLPIYTGPYRNSPAGKAAFDKAISCEGNTITYQFKKPWADFPLAIAALHMMDPYRQDKDRGEGSSFEIFSNGPYRLDGEWDKETGGTLVRNENYDPSTDSTDIRKALPDRIVFDLGKTAEQITERLIADQGRDQNAVTSEPIPATYYDRIDGDVAKRRTVTVISPFVGYLVPNFRRMTNPWVRRALAVSLDVTAAVAAGGGQNAMEEATDIVSPLVPGYQKDLFRGGAGDREKARQLLEGAGVQIPYPITFVYPRSARTLAAAIEQGWEEAGFEVTLKDVKDVLYIPIYTPGPEDDVVLWGWGADWPSVTAVVPALFDSRPNANASNLGGYRSHRFESLVDAAEQTPDPDTQTELLQQADQVLAKDVAYIPLDTPTFYLLHGSGVTGFVTTAASNSYPDLGAIGVGQ